MTDDMTEASLETTELDGLKARADLLGVSYHPSIGAEKLREKITAFQAAQESKSAPEVAAPVAAAPGVETENQRNQRLKDEALKLVRVRITCMNPTKKDWEGEIFTVGNSLIGTVKKYIPYNADNGWHIPQIMLNMLQERQCQTFVTEKAKNGVSVRRGKLIREFSIEILPQLTEKELHDLAQQQAMANRID